MPRLLAAFALPLVVACSCTPRRDIQEHPVTAQPNTAPPATGQPVVSEPRPPANSGPAPGSPEAPLDPRFVSPRDARLHATLLAWITANSRDFIARREVRLGNFVGRMYCRGATPAECNGGAIVNSERRGTAWRHLEALTYDDDASSLFGILFNLGEFPTTGDFGMRFSLIETSTHSEQRIVGEGLWLTFVRYEGDAVRERLNVGTAPSWSHRDDSAGGIEEPVLLAPSVSWQDTLRALSESPASLARFVRGQEERLLLEARARIDDGRIHGFDEGPYKGGGIPPELTARALTPKEREAAIAALTTEHARRLAFVDTHKDALHRLVVSSVPTAVLLAGP